MNRFLKHGACFVSLIDCLPTDPPNTPFNRYSIPNDPVCSWTCRYTYSRDEIVIGLSMWET